MPDFIIRQARPDDCPIVSAFVFATLRTYGVTPDPEGLDADVVPFGTAGDGPVLEVGPRDSAPRLQPGVEYSPFNPD